MRKLILPLTISLLLIAAAWPKDPGAKDLDARVKSFLESHRGKWHDMNVPEADGQSLYDIIVKHNYKRALEIGTSTGHSGIWIAWALSKTGGRLVTLEIDKDRHEQALANFREAGVASFIDARLGDAHELVPKLKGPFDFVFSDADKDWYVRYFDAVLPKLEVDGCFAAHNISERARRGYSREYLEHIRSIPFMDTSVLENGNGLAVSYKKAQ